ncbi:MAG: SMP-30/gluconolactonase/LRE family protein [Candidatus Hydrogenedens sp.]|nr:SMP-30/gluconolactonase/LRE family protein [Candidatus Hydrogenedens sp.]
MNALLILGMAALAATSAPFTEGEIETVVENRKFTEGPLYLPDGTLLFSDIPADQIYNDKDEVFREPSGQSNGLTLDGRGRLLAAEHKGRRVSITEADGTVKSLADSYDGKRLHSPNDVIVRSDGRVFFTDPPYGGNEPEMDVFGMYAVSPEGAVTRLVDDAVKPNGLALSPDEKTLYLADTDLSNIRAFDLAADGTVSNGRQLCEAPRPDGIKVDTEGNIWATCKDGVRVISPAGDLLETIEFPQQPSNCAFGGKDGKTLYVTARTGVYKVRVKVEGIRPQPAQAAE